MKTEILVVGIIVIIYLISQLINKNKVDRERNYITDINNDDRISYYLKTHALENYKFYFEENNILAEESNKIKEEINNRYTKGKKVNDKYLKTEELYIFMSVYDYLDKYVDSYEFKKNNIKETQITKGIEKTPMRKRDGYFDNGAEKFTTIEKDCPYTEYKDILNERGIVIYKMLYSAYNYLYNSGTVIKYEEYKDSLKEIIDNGYRITKYNEYRYKIID